MDTCRFFYIFVKQNLAVSVLYQEKHSYNPLAELKSLLFNA